MIKVDFIDEFDLLGRIKILESFLFVSTNFTWIEKKELKETDKIISLYFFQVSHENANLADLIKKIENMGLSLAGAGDIKDLLENADEFKYKCPECGHNISNPSVTDKEICPYCESSLVCNINIGDIKKNGYQEIVIGPMMTDERVELVSDFSGRTTISLDRFKNRKNAIIVMRYPQRPCYQITYEE